MGSCCSSQANSDKLSEKIDGEYPSAARRSRSRPSTESRAPPPTMEEETVKEVLSVSETTNIKLDRRFLGKVAEEEEEKKTEISEAAEEICSLSESLSTTTNITNDDEEATNNHHYHYLSQNARSFNRRSSMKLPSKQRSLSGELIGRRERVLGAKSPSRRAESSPGRRFANGTASVRMVQQRNSDSGRIGARGGLSPAKDSGEASARRSRSPAMRSARSPNRKCADDGLNDESFDNPLVSLECFIFL